MDFDDVLARRRMVRAYRPDPVPRSTLDAVLDAARRGPSAGHTQATTFVVVTDEADRKALAAVCGEAEHTARGLQPWLSVAPVHVVVCTEPDAYHRRYAEPDKAGSVRPADWEVPFWWVDAGAALMLLLLAAAAHELGAGFLAVPRDPVRALLDLPAATLPVGLVTLGYPARSQPEGSRRRGLRPRAEVVRHT